MAFEGSKWEDWIFEILGSGSFGWVYLFSLVFIFSYAFAFTISNVSIFG